MKINIKDIFKKYSNLYQFEEGSPEYLLDKEDFKNAIKEIVESVIDKCVEQSELSFVPHDEEAWEQKEITREDIKSFYCDGVEDDDDWVYQQIRERDGFTIEVDKESILSVKEMIDYEK